MRIHVALQLRFDHLRGEQQGQFPQFGKLGGVEMPGLAVVCEIFGGDVDDDDFVGGFE